MSRSQKPSWAGRVELVVQQHWDHPHLIESAKEGVPVPERFQAQANVNQVEDIPYDPRTVPRG